DGVHAGHHGQQDLRRADVARRLLPPDVLLARLQRQPVGPVAVRVLGNTHQTPRQRPLQARAYRQVAGVRSAESHGYAEPLGGSASDVGADRGGLAQQRQGQQVGRHGHERTLLVGRLDDGRVVAYRTGGARVLQVDAEVLESGGLILIEVDDAYVD